MTIEWWLPIGLIASAIVAIALAVRRKSWFARRKYVVAIVMSAVSALLLAALAHPTIPAQEPSTPRLIIVADVSASMVAAQDWREVVGWIESVLPAEVELTVIPFAGRPSERPLRRGQVRLTADGSQGVADSLWPGRAALGEMETNLQQALHMAAAVAGDDVRRSAIIVYSDGWWTDNHQSAAVEALRRRGLSVGALAAVKSDLPNARIVNLTAPARVDVGQPLEIEATIEANRDGAVELLLAAGVASADSAPVRVGRTVNLQAGQPQREKFAWQPTSAGLATVSVGVKMSGDAIAGDDKWQLPVQVGLRRPLLLIHGGAGGGTGDGTATVARQLASLSAGERSAELTSTMNAPQTAATLGRYAAVVLVNVSRLELGDRLERALDGYVREMGGGLLVVGGGNAFGLGGYAGGLIDELLPLTSRTEHRPPIHLALVLDRSASMIEAAGGRQKLEIAKDAVGALERVLIDGDRLSLVAFNHDYQVVLDTLGTGGTGGTGDDGVWNRVRRAVAPLVPQGGTSLGPALGEALAMLERGPESVDGRPLRRHVIVVSDGESDPFDIAAAAARAAREQISISVVATGGRQAASLVELAARGGGRYYDAAAELANPQSQNRLAQIFMDDLPLELMIAKPSAIRATGATGAAIHWPHDDGGRALPPVPAYLVTQAKERAAVHLEAAAPAATGEVGDVAIDWHPLAASWQLGLGRAAALPVAADVPGVIDWLKLPQIAPGVTTTIQWLASEDTGHADFEAVVRVEHGVLHAEVRQRRLPDVPEASPGMRLALYSLENRRTIALPLKLVAPGHWRRRLTLSGGAYSYVLRSVETGDKRGGDGSGSDELAEGRLIASGTVSGGVAAELRRQGINGPALARLAETGGGGVLTSPAQAAEIELPQEVRRDLRPLLVVVAIMILLGQLAADLLASRRRS